MNQELKVRVVLDTEEAKKQLAGLTGSAGAGGGGSGGGAGGGGGLAGRVAAGLGRGLASTMSYGPRLLAGVGRAALSDATSALVDPTRSSLRDIIGETFGGYGAEAENMLLGTGGAEARAAARTRESVAGMFAMQAGREGAIPAQAYSVRDQLYRWSRETEIGRSMIERDPAFREGGALMQVFENGAARIGEAMGAAIERAAQQLPTFGR